MATFTGKQIKNTYQGIVQIDAGVLKDAVNNPLTASIDALAVENNLEVSGSLIVTGSIESSLKVNGVFSNKQELNIPFTVPAGYNAALYGPVTFNTDVTIDETANLTILIL